MPKAICVIESCEADVRGRGLCDYHYKQWKRMGDDRPDLRTKQDFTAEERFWAKVDKRGPDECWPYLGGPFTNYGLFYPPGGPAVMAHRFSFALVHGPIREGLHIDHTCHTNDLSCAGGPTCPHRRCMNPRHMEPVTLIENVARGRSVSAVNASKTHCIHGHEFTPENTYRVVRVASGRVRRMCRACIAESEQRSRRRRCPPR